MKIKDAKFWAGNANPKSAPFFIGDSPKSEKQRTADVLIAKTKLDEVQVALLKLAQRKGAQKKRIKAARKEVLEAIGFLDFNLHGVLRATSLKK